MLKFCISFIITVPANCFLFVFLIYFFYSRQAFNLQLCQKNKNQKKTQFKFQNFIYKYLSLDRTSVMLNESENHDHTCVYVLVFMILFSLYSSQNNLFLIDQFISLTTHVCIGRVFFQRKWKDLNIHLHCKLQSFIKI